MEARDILVDEKRWLDSGASALRVGLGARHRAEQALYHVNEFDLRVVAFFYAKNYSLFSAPPAAPG